MRHCSIQSAAIALLTVLGAQGLYADDIRIDNANLPPGTGADLQTRVGIVLTQTVGHRVSGIEHHEDPAG